MSKQVVGGSQPGGAYSPGIIAEGRFLYVAGQVPTRDGVVVGETVAEQTKVVLENMAAVLAAGGASLAVFPEPLPARTTVGVSLLGFKVEIDCVAVLPTPA